MAKRLFDWLGPEVLKIPFNIMAHTAKENKKKAPTSSLKRIASASISDI